MFRRLEEEGGQGEKRGGGGGAKKDSRFLAVFVLVQTARAKPSVRVRISKIWTGPDRPANVGLSGGLAGAIGAYHVMARMDVYERRVYYMKVRVTPETAPKRPPDLSETIRPANEPCHVFPMGRPNKTLYSVA